MSAGMMERTLPHPDGAPRTGSATRGVPSARREPVPGRRRLIACCDGTWNRPNRHGHSTNVVRMARAIRPRSEEGVSQVVQYLPGVGTGNALDRWVGGATGAGLSENVRRAYAFFVDNYCDGDELFLFGFSRGAYTARAVAGVMGHVGLLRKHHMENFDEVWDYYRQPEVARKAEERAGFLDQFPDRLTRRDLTIRCIGVWDTVGALGIPNSRFCQQAYAFHDTTLGPGVEHAFHALAVDERREPYRPAVWTPNPAPRVAQTVEQVWFPGAHSNVGGGYPERVLSDAAFFWMASRVAPLLDLDLDYICATADRSPPLGRLVDTLTWSWRLTTGSHARRVCGTAPGTEYIHESVWQRAASEGGQPVPAPYRDAEFRRFLDGKLDRKAALSDYEREILDRIPRTPLLEVLPRRHRNRAFCERVVALVGGGAR